MRRLLAAEEASLSAEPTLLSAAASTAVVRGFLGRAVGGRRGAVAVATTIVTLVALAESAEGALEVFLDGYAVVW